MFQAPQMSDYPDTDEGHEAYYQDADAFYGQQQCIRYWSDVAAAELSAA